MSDAPTSNPPRFLPTYDNCFVCGRRHPRGLHLRFFTRDDGIAYVEFAPEDTLTGYDDIVHGGIIATVFDELLGWAVGIRTDQLFVTGELTVRYLRPVLSNHTYLCSARPAEEKKRFWTATGEMHDPDGTVCTRAEGKFFPLGRDRTREVADRLNYQPDDLPVFLDEVN